MNCIELLITGWERGVCLRATDAAEGVGRDGGEGHLADGGAGAVEGGRNARRPHAPAPRADGEEVVVVLPLCRARCGVVVPSSGRGGGDGKRASEVGALGRGGGGEGEGVKAAAAAGGGVEEEERLARGHGAGYVPDRHLGGGGWERRCRHGLGGASSVFPPPGGVGRRNQTETPLGLGPPFAACAWRRAAWGPVEGGDALLR